MFTLLKSLRSRQVYLSEPVSFVAALVIAELFYKFKSFLLETGAFLLTWFVLGAIVHTITKWLLPVEPSGERRQ
jgi:hypothetical protein